MRSVVVVLPASICAMMPMLRQRSIGKVRATAKYLEMLGVFAPGDRMKECLRKTDSLAGDAGFYTRQRPASSSLEQAPVYPPAHLRVPKVSPHVFRLRGGAPWAGSRARRCSAACCPWRAAHNKRAWPRPAQHAHRRPARRKARIVARPAAAAGALSGGGPVPPALPSAEGALRMSAALRAGAAPTRARAAGPMLAPAGAADASRRPAPSKAPTAEPSPTAAAAPSPAVPAARACLAAPADQMSAPPPHATRAKPYGLPTSRVVGPPGRLDWLQIATAT